jgi:hypothetical protein
LPVREIAAKFLVESFITNVVLLEWFVQFHVPSVSAGVRCFFGKYHVPVLFELW